MANLTDADKVLRNDTGKDIVTKLNNIATAIQTSGTTSLYVITDAFDSTATYDVGSYVIYNSSLYKCTTAVTVAGAFDPSDWETVQVMDEIPDNVAGAIAMTQAQWDAIVDKAAWRNAHKNSYLVITDAPNLNPTASDIEYSGAVTVKQAIALTDISSSLTMDSNYFTASTKQMYKSGNTITICLRGSLTATSGTVIGTISTYYPKCDRIICDFHNNSAPTPITTGAVWINGQNAKIYYFGSSTSNLDVCITVTFLANVY